MLMVCVPCPFKHFTKILTSKIVTEVCQNLTNFKPLELHRKNKQENTTRKSRSCGREAFTFNSMT